MKINLRQIRIIDDIVNGRMSAMSIYNIRHGEGAPVTPSVQDMGDGTYGLVFGINHFYAAKLDGCVEMDVVVLEEEEGND
jgi:hypothetical protein